MNNHFGVSVGVKLVTSALQFCSQFWKIVNLAIENYPNFLIFVVDGLVTARKVNNAQSSHAEANWPLGINSLIVGPAVNDGLAHPPDVGSIDCFTFSPYHARYPAHRFTSAVFAFLKIVSTTQSP